MFVCWLFIYIFTSEENFWRILREVVRIHVSKKFKQWIKVGRVNKPSSKKKTHWLTEFFKKIFSTRLQLVYKSKNVVQNVYILLFFFFLFHEFFFLPWQFMNINCNLIGSIKEWQIFKALQASH